MTRTRRRLLRDAPLALAAGAAMALPRPARAAWPERPLRLVVAFPPGGAVDRIARLVQPRIAEFLGQSVVVENRGGGAGVIALNSVAAAPADGHSILVDDLSFLVSPLLSATGAGAYPVTFRAVGALAEMPVMLAASRQSGIGSFEAYLQTARLAELPLVYGTPGIGSIGHVAGALLGHRTGLRFQHVPYRGSADMARDLAGGRLDSAYLTPSTFLTLAEAGRAVPLAISSGGWEGLPPGLPRLDRFGLEGTEEAGAGLANWVAAFIPDGTPRDARLMLEAALDYATQDQDLARILAGFGARPVTGPLSGFRRRLVQEEALLRRLVAEAGLGIPAG
ncbi:tripartite tricarboxylate transporter substrate binding protein [Pseudoroseomonas cervicalis]|uniref:Bug family tripartite tricarboxylate transporter substrate binding protein n=1 Tax=Teichococcus cervicalis TaxID=204525 RepID=UPI00278102C0|nr:tripartite tricarboxylate transporter substrate binding protein [Pseudoroseomonas cervicalis]MDQ1081889.1 tripartite-type tricarboxylate transporter receptor subunit TctC [Pseudoroseomonas cervicalis]